MVELANLFLKCEKRVIENLINYYNNNCFELVKPERRYKMKVGDNWCAMFTSVIAHIANLSDFPYEVSVYEQVKIAESRGIFSRSIKNISVNDLIIYDWSSNGFPNHVGIVSEIKDGFLTVVEGNKGGSVNKRVVRNDSSSIYGMISL